MSETKFGNRSKRTETP